MLYIKKYIKENISILIVLVCFSFIAIFNAFMNIGIIEDGSHHFFEALVANNIWTGHEGETFSFFPFNSRYFPSLIQHLSVGILVFLGVTNIKILLFVFTFVCYFLPIIILLIVYLNIPKHKRNCFEIILLYFLICMNFMIYHIWTENFLTGLFLWVIFVIYYYIDFNKLSKFNLICLVTFSMCLISSHPMTAVFVIPMIAFAIVKQYKTKNIPSFTKTILILSYTLLFISFIFNLYFIFRPIYSADDYLSFYFLKNPVFIYFFIFVLIILIMSLINNNKIKKFFTFICGLVCIGILYFVFLEINSSDGYSYRILGFYIPLSLMLFILFKDFLKFTMNYNYIKSINFILVIIFLLHSIFYGLTWNKYLINVQNIMMTRKQINFMQISKYSLFHSHNIPYDCIFIAALFDIKPNYKIILSEQNLMSGHIKRIKKYEKKLSNFNIKVDSFVTN